ncbi:MAG: HD domain-containing phosphohydrolase [bacterium]
MWEILYGLLSNVILLFALIFIYGVINFWPTKTKVGMQILIGIMTTGIAVLVMMNPWQVEEGLIYDTRSVLLLVTAAFFGVIPSVIAGLATAAYRIFVIGGIGVYAGVLTVIASVGMGLLWRKFRKNRTDIRYYLEFLVLGFITHILVVASQLTIPWPRAFEVIGNIALPFLVFYPILTGVLAVALRNQELRVQQALTIRNDAIILKTAIESPKNISIIVVDREMKYLAFNGSHLENMKNFFQTVPHVGACILNFVTDEKTRDIIRTNLERAFTGESMLEMHTYLNDTVSLESRYSPIIDDAGNVTGATMFSQNITERQKKDEAILHLSYHDVLTGLLNRRAYSEELKRPSHERKFPITVVMADINGLKITNDAFGHFAGDELLLTVTDLFKKHCRPDDLVYRIGGDEFVILMPETNRVQAEKIVDQIKADMDQTVLYGLTMSVSFGLDTDIDGTDLVDSVKCAEIEMYNQKLFELSSNRAESIKTILKTLNLKNPREDIHSRRVSEFCSMIGELLGMRREQVSVLKMIGNLHDIGKIAIEESLLNKATALTAEDWKEIRRHPEIGFRILSSSAEYADIAEDILAHHERWDGRGYPRGLRGEQIPLRARIIAVADTFEAMTANRAYRQAVSEEEALQEIERCAGTQFDPEIAALFVAEFRRRMTGPEK